MMAALIVILLLLALLLPMLAGVRRLRDLPRTAPDDGTGEGGTREDGTER